jgi:hypothetical protein
MEVHLLLWVKVRSSGGGGGRSVVDVPQPAWLQRVSEWNKKRDFEINICTCWKHCRIEWLKWYTCKPLRFLKGCFAKSPCLQTEGLLTNQKTISKFASQEDREWYLQIWRGWSAYIADSGGCTVYGVGLWPLDWGDRGFESSRGHGYPSLVSAVCCQIEVSAAGQSFVQRSHTKCDVSAYDLETTTMRRRKPTTAVQPYKKNLYWIIVDRTNSNFILGAPGVNM